MKLSLPRRPILALLGASSIAFLATGGAAWHFGWVPGTAASSLLPWMNASEADDGAAAPPAGQEAMDEHESAGHGNGKATTEGSAHGESGEAKTVFDKTVFDRAVLAADVKLKAESLKELRLPLKALIDAQTALAYGEATAASRHKQAQSAFADRIKNLGRRTLTGQEVEQVTVYLFSGGDPSLVENVLHSLEVDPPNKMLLESAIAYVSRDLELADSKLGKLDPARLPPPVLSRVLLVQSQTTASLDAAEKAHMLEKAASLSPGTLVEEASIRRLVQLWADVGNTSQMMKWSRKYLKRFPKSYYMNDFVRSFAAGVMKTARRGGRPGADDIGFVLKSLEVHDAVRLALQITRASLDAGLREVCITFAAAASEVLPKNLPEQNALLVHGLACKAAETPEAVLGEIADRSLNAIDGESLKVLRDAQNLASNILRDDQMTVSRTPGEAQESEGQLETFAASVAQQLKGSFKLLQESRK